VAADEAGFLADLEVEQPEADEVIPVESVRERAVVLREGGFFGRTPSGRICLVLDRDRVRDVGAADARALTLGALLPEDGDLPPGEHVLAVVACDADGRALRDAHGKARVAFRRFFVGGSRPAGDASTPGVRVEAGVPMLIVLHPRGTFNGPLAAEGAVLDVIVHGVDLTARPEPGQGRPWVEVAVGGAGPRSTAALPGEGRFRVLGLTSGDHTVDVVLRGAPPGGWASARRQITVNLDAPGAPGEKPR
jgi:hypothetical protein